MSLKEATFLPRLCAKPPFTVNAPDYDTSAVPSGETIPRRNADAVQGLVTKPESDVSTVWDIVTRGAVKFGDHKAVGTRRLVKTYNEVKKVKKIVDGVETEVEKKWTYYELSGYSYLSFKGYEQLARQVGAGYRSLGLEAGDRVHIYAGTSLRWLAIAHGAMSQSMPIVTAYDTLGEDGLRESLVATNVKAIFLDPHLLKILMNTLEAAKSVQVVIYNNDHEIKEEDINKLRTTYPYIKLLSFEELQENGKNSSAEVVAPTAQDLCCIMYTSGSSGKPKGVPLKHKNVVAAVAGADLVVGKYIGPGDGLLAYLPLAHIFEFMFENACLYWGGTMGYGNPKTLSDTSVKNCKGDMREFRPSILVGVPAVWETVKKGIIGKVEAGGFVTKNLFWGAYSLKNSLVSAGLPGSGVLDAVVFSKVREATGGRLRVVANGAGPIARDTQRFISMVIAPMVSGYGLTETCGMGALCDPMAWTDSALGNIPGCIDVKLVDFADAGYFATNNPPQGEIWVRGENVMDGYYENEAETAEALTPDGWFKTGDIGEWDNNGHLKIIDRKKNMVKTLNGEYIALEKLESVYRATTIVGNICICASANRAKPVAIVAPVEAALKNLASEIGLTHLDGLSQLAHNDRLQSAVLNEMQIVGRKAGLAGIEIVEGVVLADEEWTPQSGLLTPTQKLNRRAISEQYKKHVELAYAQNS